MDIGAIVEIAQVVVNFATSLGICIMVFTFLINNKVKSGEWLKSLYEKFLKQVHLKKSGEKLSIQD